MFVRRKTLIVVASVALLAGCSQPDLAVHGDSTAIASRDGLAKAWNIAPSFDGKRWWNIVSKSFTPSRPVLNTGVGGQSIFTMRDKMVADKEHRSITTVIYDRRNDGEDAATYVATLAEAVGTLETDRFLFLPQVARSKGFAEAADQAEAMPAIDEAVAARWPNNTFSAAERAAFVAALSDDDTRYDGLHRNARGQQIEAEHIGGWLRARSW